LLLLVNNGKMNLLIENKGVQMSFNPIISEKPVNDNHVLNERKEGCLLATDDQQVAAIGKNVLVEPLEHQPPQPTIVLRATESQPVIFSKIHQIFLKELDPLFLSLGQYPPFQPISLNELKFLKLSSLLKLSLLTLFSVLHNRAKVDIHPEASSKFLESILDGTYSPENLLTTTFKTFLAGNSFPGLERAFKLIVKLLQSKECQEMTVETCLGMPSSLSDQGVEMGARKPVIDFIKILIEQVSITVQGCQNKNKYPVYEAKKLVPIIKNPNDKRKSLQKTAQTVEMITDRCRDSRIKIGSKLEEMTSFVKNMKFESSNDRYRIDDLLAMISESEKLTHKMSWFIDYLAALGTPPPSISSNLRTMSSFTEQWETSVENLTSTVDNLSPEARGMAGVSEMLQMIPDANMRNNVKKMMTQTKKNLFGMCVKNEVKDVNAGIEENVNAAINDASKSLTTFIELTMSPYKILSPILLECRQGIKSEEIELIDESWMMGVDAEPAVSQESPLTESKEAEIVNNITVQDEEVDEKTFTNPGKLKPVNIKKVTLQSTRHDSAESTLVAGLRTILADYYGIKNEHFAPAQGWGKLQPYQIAEYQTLHALDMLQWIFEQAKTAPDQTKKLLNRQFKLHLQLAFEQALTAEYLRRNPKGTRTHSLYFLMNELGLDASLNHWMKDNHYGTLEYRYPFAFKKLNLNEEFDVEKSGKDFNEFSLALNQMAGTPSLDELKEKLEVVNTEQPAPEACSDEMVQECQKIMKTLEKTRSNFVQIIQNASLGDQYTKALKNANYHLEHLSYTALLMQQNTENRFLHKHLLMAIFSTQYFLENIGVALSIHHSQTEVHDHDLRVYCNGFGLDKDLSEAEKQTLLDMNVRKGSEYLYNNQRIVKGLQLLSDRYLTARVATVAGEGFQSQSQPDKKGKIAVLEDIEYLGRMVNLISKVIPSS